MKIGIDARLWSQTGVGRYIRNLVSNLLMIDQGNEYVLFVRAKDKSEVENQISEFKIKNPPGGEAGLKLKIVTANYRWHSVSEQLRFPQVINRQNVDLMHFTYQQSVPFSYSKPYVVTVHDLIKHHFVTGNASTGPLWLYGFKMIAYRILIKSTVKSAKKIIAVSNFTKRDIINNLGVKSEKIEVIYEAADDFDKNVAKGKELENYFLYVGNIYPHKNVGTLVAAFKKLHEKNSKLKLVFVGQEDPFYKKLKSDLKKYEEKGNIIFFENVSDEKLVGLYRHAIALVRPSLMEGFSLPPLEAAAQRCLVLASDIPVHREIFGDSLIYFDPYNPSDILAKMEKILKISQKDKEEILKKQFEIQKRFSWKETAQRTLRVYESSLGI